MHQIQAGLTRGHLDTRLVIESVEYAMSLPMLAEQTFWKKTRTSSPGSVTSILYVLQNSLWPAGVTDTTWPPSGSAGQFQLSFVLPADRECLTCEQLRVQLRGYSLSVRRHPDRPVKDRAMAGSRKVMNGLF